MKVHIKLLPFVPVGSVLVCTRNGPSIDATNEDVAENVKIMESTIDNVSTSFSYSFEKHSVTVLVFSGSTTAVEPGTDQIPNQFRLMQNYPNPFNPTTTIRYGIPHSSQVNLTIFDILGRKVTTLIDKQQTIGWHEVQWDGMNDKGKSMSSGVYVVRFKSGAFVDVKKILLME